MVLGPEAGFSKKSMTKNRPIRAIALLALIGLAIRCTWYLIRVNVSLYIPLPVELQNAEDIAWGASSNPLSFAMLPTDSDSSDDTTMDAAVEYIRPDNPPFQAPELRENHHPGQKQQLASTSSKNTKTILSPSPSKFNPPKPRSFQGQQRQKQSLRNQNGTQKMPKIVLPNVLIAGAQKAGSSALSNWLFRAGVCKAAVFPGEPAYYSKEPHFFGTKARFSQGLPFYARRYERCQFGNRTMIARFRLDATPTTLLHPDEVYSFYQSAGGSHLRKLKIIVSLREPVARELSLYNHQLSRYQKHPDPTAWYATIATANGTIKSFDDFIETVTIPGLNNTRQASSLANYAKHLKRWFELFDPDNILILSYQEDIRESDDGKDRVRQFLNYSFEGRGPLAESNAHAGTSKLRSITCSARDRLQTIFQPMNEDLYQLLARQKRPSFERQPFPPFGLPECTG